MTLVDDVWLYSDIGWALTKLDGKKSIGQGWQNTRPLDPTSAVSVFSGWSGNIGLVLGPSGVIDYEMDSGDEAAYFALLGGEIPSTPAYRTGSGKMHILFRDPGGLSRTTRGGLELRAGNHQSVIPPSVHPETGKQYKWINHPAEYDLLDPPPALLDFFAQPNGGVRGNHWREPLRGGKLGPGQGRHEATISFLGKMVNVVENVEQLVAAAITYADLTQNPPYPENELTQWAHRVWDSYREEQQAEARTAASDYLKITTLDRVAMRSVRFVWKPFLQRSAFHLLVGRKGAGKGSFISWVAAQETNGQLEGGHPRPVLWIATEDSFEIDVAPRIVAQGGNPKMILTANKRVRLPEDLDHIEAVCQEHGVGMVVIDPIVGVLGGADSNAEGPIVAAIGGLNDLADRLDLMVLGVRHLGKSVDRGVLEAVLGSAAWVNTPRVVLGIAQDEEDKVVTLQVLAGNRSRSRSSYDFLLDEAMVPGLEEPVSKVIPTGESFKDISDVIAKQPRGKKYEAVRGLVMTALKDDIPTTKEFLLPEVMKLGSSRTTLERVCKDLKDEGLLEYIVPPERDEKGKVKDGQRWYIKKGPLAA